MDAKIDLNKAKLCDQALIREQFSCLNQVVNGCDLVFLDTAASAQKPSCVLEKIHTVYAMRYANIHRGLYSLSEALTEEFEQTRKQIASFINAESCEVVFTRNATEAINLVASSYGSVFVNSGQNIVISDIEHHANIVPWQQLCKKNGAELRAYPIDELVIDENTAIVAITHMSNVLGELIDLGDIIDRAHKMGAKVLVDACQSIAHVDVDVKLMDCDFLVCSSHKIYGPSGVGLLYGKYSLLEQMEPYQFGGEMVREVSIAESSFQPPPIKFEAGTPAIAEVIGLGAAIDFLSTLDCEVLRQHESLLISYIVEQLQMMGDFKILGGNIVRHSLVSFVHSNINSHDIGHLLNKMGIAVRVGHHCAQPVMEKFGVISSIRVSVGVYNTFEDVEQLMYALKKIVKMF